MQGKYRNTITEEETSLHAIHTDKQRQPVKVLAFGCKPSRRFRSAKQAADMSPPKLEAQQG
jgi:hypothetical protein